MSIQAARRVRIPRSRCARPGQFPVRLSTAPCHCKTIRLTVAGMADTITIRTDDETIRQAVLEAASRRERAAEMRREVLRMDLGQPDGVNVAEELARDRASE
jgi:hypothetical protein